MIGSSEGSSGRDFMKRGRDSSSASFSSGDFAFGGGWGNVAAMVLSVVLRKDSEGRVVPFRKVVSVTCLDACR